MVNETAFAPWDDPAAKPLIRFRDVTKRFGSFTAIDDLSLDIYEREFFALLGPSGCGKTTLMRMLAGFETPTEGSIELAGEDIASVPPNKRAVNMMFQSYALFPHLSVWDNIAFGLRREGQARDAIAARVEDMLKLTRLETFARRKPHQISGGQRQRVALARALAKAPKLLLLDEPLGALDKKLRQETQFELMDIQEKTGTTFVIVTHDQEEAMTVASRVAVMDEGRIIQVATPVEIYEAPTSVYVADFIGDVNLIKGTPRLLENGQFLFDWNAKEAPLVVHCAKEIVASDACHIALRPEKVSIYASQPDTQNAVKGRIVDIGYLGNLSTYHVALESGQVLKAQSANTERQTGQAFSWDDEVWLGWSASAGVLLDR